MTMFNVRTRIIGATRWLKIDNVFSHFVRTIECDRQAGTQTDRIAISMYGRLHTVAR